MKQLCLGIVKLPSGISLPSLFDASLDEREFIASRQWFVVEQAEVAETEDGVLVPTVRIGIEARRLVCTDNGIEDAPSTDPKEPAVLFAQVFSKQFPLLMGHYPVFG